MGTPPWPGRPAAGDDVVITGLACESPATAVDPGNVPGEAPSVSGAAYIYGYDSGGNPTLTNAGDGCPSGREPGIPRQS